MNDKKNTLNLLMPTILIILAGLVFVFRPEVIKFIFNAIKPLLISFAAAYLLDALVRVMVRKFKIRRTQAILLTCIIVISLISIIFSIFVPILIENSNAVISFVMDSGSMDFEDIINNIVSKFDNKYMKDIADELMEISEDIKLKINELIKYFYNILINSVAVVGSSIITVITGFILAIYMLVEKDDLLARARRFICAFFSEQKSQIIFEISKNANRIFRSFLVGRVTDSLIVALITITVFTVFKIPYAPLMGSIIGIFNLIPFFGPIIGAIPVVVVSFITSPSKALAAIIIIIVIGQLDGNFIDPKVVGNNVGVSPFWVISAVIVGGALLGPVGMILGVPLVVLVKSVIEDIVKSRLSEKNMENFELENLRKIKVKKR